MLKADTTADNYAATLDDGQTVTSNVPFVVTHVEPCPNYQLFVKFIDGTAGDVELRGRVLREDAGVFKSLRDEAAFADVFVDDGVVTWTNGVDLAPDAMYDEIKANGVWVLR